MSVPTLSLSPATAFVRGRYIKMSSKRQFTVQEALERMSNQDAEMEDVASETEDDTAEDADVQFEEDSEDESAIASPPSDGNTGHWQTVSFLHYKDGSRVDKSHHHSSS